MGEVVVDAIVIELGLTRMRLIETGERKREYGIPVDRARLAELEPLIGLVGHVNQVVQMHCGKRVYLPSLVIDGREIATIRNGAWVTFPEPESGL